ncbi:hypothetical protein ASZ78_009481 [Callipepla squamata]|uniref:Uncharacterized protein n=1 Tax=Callipepla squamata TaxID=9009 RepID=A0A226MRD7_CALSU|nr:hypothetical protein ASZ78_009481 [Callipepla squamata]
MPGEGKSGKRLYGRVTSPGMVNLTCFDPEDSDDSLPDDNSVGDKELIHVYALISPSSAEDTDLNPPDIGVTSLDCDPSFFQGSPPQAESKCPSSSTSMQEQVGITEEKPSVLKEDLVSGSQSPTLGSTMSSEPVSS